MKEPEAEREELLLLLEALVSACETASHPDLLHRSLQQDSHGDYLQGKLCVREPRPDTFLQATLVLSCFAS